MRTFKSLPSFILAGLLAAPVTIAAQESKNNDNRSELTQLASAADTPSEHSQVARQFRARAADLNAAAVKHESEVRRLERQRYPYEHKQPAALANRTVSRERQLAMEARRGAREALEMAELHTQLAVELLASR